MKGDFSRLFSNSGDNYNQVLLQQGRVLLDSDFNAFASFSADRMRQLGRDIFGPHAGPVDANKETGFFIKPVGNKFQVGAGSYYVDGLRVENTAPALRDPVQDLKMDSGVLYLLYLDVWQRHVTWLDNDDLSEPALGGPDTATRVQVAWKLRTFNLNDEESPHKITDWDEWLKENLQRWPRGANTGRPQILPQLRAWTDPQPGEDDVPCVADPAGGFRGLENQLYRVEIHTGRGDDGSPPTFKWSRENGSVAAPWLKTDGNDLVVEGIHDTARGFSAGQWVELTSLENEESGQPGVMAQLIKVDGLRLTIDPGSQSGPLPTPVQMKHPVVRRWDQRENRNDKGVFKNGVLVLDETRDSYPLESGINIAFPALSANMKDSRVLYQPGDYWLIPGRPAIADIIWPKDPTATAAERYLALEPFGVEHNYAPLALVQVDADTPSVQGKSLQRKYTPPVRGF